MSNPNRRGAGQRAGLTRVAVLDAARRIADEEGVDRLTMRRLGDELGVMPNALYTYVSDKDALLDAVLDDLLGDVVAQVGEAEPWREALIRILDASRRLLLDHPQLVPVFLSRPGLGRNAAILGETTFRLLRRAGLEGERAVEAFRVLLIYTLGFAAFQAPRRQADSAARTARGEAAFGSLPEDAFPEMRRVARYLAMHPSDENFQTGLRWLLDGMTSVKGGT